MTFITLNGHLRSETDPEVIYNLIRKGWSEAPQPQFDPATQECNWVDGAWVVTPKPPAPAPAEIPLWAFRSAIALSGMTPQVVAMIDALPEPDKTVAFQQWEYANWISRNHETIDEIANALGLTPSQIDDIFRLGDSLT